MNTCNRAQEQENVSGQDTVGLSSTSDWFRKRLKFSRLIQNCSKEKLSTENLEHSLFGA